MDYARKHVNQASSAVQEHWVRGGAARSLLRDGGGRRRLKDHFLPFEERVRQAPHIFGIDATPANTYCRVGGSGIAHVPRVRYYLPYLLVVWYAYLKDCSIGAPTDTTR